MVSQAGIPLASQADSTLPLAVSAVSQAGNPQASLADNTLCQAESGVYQAGITQAAPVVIHSARLRASQVSPITTLMQATLLGQTMPSCSQIAWLPRLVLPRKQGLPPPNRQNSPQDSSSTEEPNPKWVINLSSKPLNKAQRSVLAKGPNFVISPEHP